MLIFPKKGLPKLATSKAISFSKFGQPNDVVSLVDQEVPDTLKNGEIMVKTLYSPINPSDYLTIMGLYPSKIRKFPAIPGLESSVEVVKSDSPNIKVGDRGIVIDPYYGKWRQMGIVNCQQFVKVPKQLPPEITATLIVNPLTAYL